MSSGLRISRKIPAKPSKGGKHDSLTEFPFYGAIDGGGSDARLWSSSAQRSHPGPLRLVDSSLHPRLRAVSVGTDVSLEPIAARRPEQHPPACRRLHQSDLEARGGGTG